MIAAAAQLTRRILGWHVAFSAGTSLLVGLLAPYLVLLKGPVALYGAATLVLGGMLGGLIGLFHNYLRLKRHRFLLRSLALESHAIEPHELRELSDEPPWLTWGWVIPTVVTLALTTIVWRPSVMDLSTGVTLCMLGAIIVAAASLLILVIVRTAILRALELAPPEIMREVVEAAERSGAMRRRISRRLLVAIVTPVGFLAIGSALIANAHLRRADEHDREETARTLARATLELGPGLIAGAGLEAAVDAAEELGFSAVVRATPAGYRVAAGSEGRVILTAPLDKGSADVRFSGSTVGVLSVHSVLIALLAVAAAVGCGMLLGSLLRKDLQNATLGVRLLGTDAVLRGRANVMSPARFAVVAQLGYAIEQLAETFRVFARAQERAIDARERAARMRGLFFASVSHDLKSPLNAILGFTELVRQTETVTAGQSESLGLIERRGKELLALIETILDAARVEAGQLTLLFDPVEIGELLAQAVDTGKNLAGDIQVEVITEIAPGLRKLLVDPVRLPRALSTFIGHAVRTASQPVLRVRAAPEGGDRARIEVEAPGDRFTARQLQAMLDPSRQPGEGEHRGLALGLSVARSIVELHGGTVQVLAQRHGALFSVLLPLGPDDAARKRA